MGTSKNNLFPIFLKAEELNILVVGGGNVALEKVHALVGNSPDTKIKLVSPLVNEELIDLAKIYKINVLVRDFEIGDLDETDLVIVAINNKIISRQIRDEAKKRKLLTNVADTPHLCDFYLSSIVQKGNLKIAISTNGQSPTMAKRIKEVLNETIPNEIDELIENLNKIRNNLNGDFQFKVKELNRITQSILNKT
jgi:siroheme synthase-like protein